MLETNARPGGGGGGGGGGITLPANGSITVPVYFDVITDGVKVPLTLAGVQDQIDVLNGAFASTPYTLNLVFNQTVVNSNRYTGCYGSGNQMKSALRRGGSNTKSGIGSGSTTPFKMDAPHQEIS